MEPSRRSPSEAPAPTRPRPPGCSPAALASPQSRPAVPSACRALPCTLAPHAHQALAQMSPDPGGTPATPQGHPWSLTPQDRAPVLTAPPWLQGHPGGPPCLRGGPRAGGHRAGLLASQHNQEGRGGLAQVGSGLRSQDPASFSLSGSPDPLAVPTQRARAPAGRQPRPPPL